MKSTLGAPAAGRLGGMEGEVAIARMCIIAPVVVRKLAACTNGFQVVPKDVVLTFRRVFTVEIAVETRERKDSKNKDHKKLS